MAHFWAIMGAMLSPIARAVLPSTRLLQLAAPGLLVLAAFAPNSHGQSGLPNVIVIVSDDQSTASIGSLGGAIQTPHIDRLVAHGFRFDNTYSMGANNAAVCAPSRAMFLTGRHLADAWNTTSINGVATIPSHFGAAGYRTFGTGKWHQGQASFVASFDAGDDIYFGGCIGCSATSHHQNTAAMNQSYSASLSRLAAGVVTGGITEPGVHVSERFAGAAGDFIAQQPSTTPYLAYVSFTAPHDPRTSPPPFRDLYRDAQGTSTVALPPNFATVTPIPRSAFDGGIRDEILLNSIGGHTPANVREELADYYGMVSHMDQEIGGLLDEALRAEGLDPAVDDIGDLVNTLLVFTSDHGLAMGSHGLMGKQNPFEHSIRAAPLVIAGAVGGTPIPTGATGALVYLSDMFPTLTELAGISTPASVDGVSLAPIIFGSQSSVRPSIYNAYRGLSRAVRSGDQKLMYYPGLDRVQLFDLADDPHEINDLSFDATRWADIEALGAEMRQLESQLNAPAVGAIPDQFFGGLEIAWAEAKDVSGVSDIPAGAAVVALSGGSSVVTAGGIQFQPVNLGGGAFTGALNGRSTSDAGYDALLDSFTFGGGQAATIDLSGLERGRSYELRVWFTDLRPGSDGRTITASNLGRVAVGAETAAPPLHQVTIAGNLPGSDPPGFLGQLAWGTFTAYEASEALRLIPNGFGNAHVNALLVTESTDPGARYCSQATLNSTGAVGRMDALGSSVIANGDLTLRASSLPQATFGYFLSSQSRGLIFQPGGSLGVLCLSGPIDRYVGPGQVQNSGVAGAFQISLDLNLLPTPNGFVAPMPGESWHFTCWHRDQLAGIPFSNFTDAVTVSFQ